jgi:hypothetical protein
MLGPRIITSWLLVFGAIFYTAFDLWAARTPGATISEVLINYFYRHPVAPFTLGALLGHLTWPSVTVRPHSETIAIVCSYIALSAVMYLLNVIPAVLPVIPLVLGLPFGHLSWPQRTVVEMGQIETPAAITPTPGAMR